MKTEKMIFAVVTVVWMALILLVALMAAGCQKALTVAPQPYTPTISIEGLLQPGTMPRIYVNNTTSFFRSIETQTASTLFTRDARVQIAGGGTVDDLVADSTFNLFFCRWEPYYVGSEVIQASTQYTLNVVNKGQTYTATTVTNVPQASIDSVSYTANFVDIFGGHEGVIVSFTDIPGQKNQYRFISRRPLNNEHQTTDDWEYSSTCLPDGQTTPVEEIGRFVFFDENLDGAPVRFVAEPFYTIYEGDRAEVFVQSVDEEVAKFYDTLDRQHEANVNPFAEPVLLYTQIEGAIGVFGAVMLSEPFDFVFPEDALN